MGDPLRGVETLDDVEVAPSEAALLAGEDVSETPFADLFGLLRGPSDDASETVDSDASEQSAVADSAEPVEADRPGFFGLRSAASAVLTGFSGQDTDTPERPAEPIKFGEIAPACGVDARKLGEKIASVAGFAVYDSAPGSTALRPHYVTGFRDGCPRQFKAALMLLGDVGTHEIVRYSETRVRLAYSQTDEAYEAIKSSFCNAPEGEPCGRRLERLGRKTTFVTAYETFGAGPVWAEFLLYDGRVAASDLEGL